MRTMNIYHCRSGPVSSSRQLREFTTQKASRCSTRRTFRPVLAAAETPSAEAQPEAQPQPATAPSSKPSKGKGRKQQAAAAGTEKTFTRVAKAKIEDFFIDNFNPNIARIYVTPSFIAEDLAVLIKRILLQRPEAEICLKANNALCKWIATKAIAQAQVALIMDRRIGLHVQPKKLDGAKPPMLLWVSRDPDHKLDWTTENRFIVGPNTKCNGLFGAMMAKFGEAERLSISGSGKNAVAVAWDALALAREKRAQLGLLDLKITPALQEMTVSASASRPEATMLGYLLMVEVCERKQRPIRPLAGSPESAAVAAEAAAAKAAAESADAAGQKQQAAGSSAAGSGAAGSMEAQQAAPGELQQGVDLTPEQVQELVLKVEQMQAQLRRLQEAEAAKQEAAGQATGAAVA